MGGKKRTHCKKGHEYTPENSMIDKRTGWNNCRTCKYAHIAARREKPEVRKYNAEREKKRRSDPVKNRAILDRLKFRLYKLTLEEYNQKLENQGQKCTICGASFLEEKVKPHIDHDHQCCSGKESCGECVRDILCYNCNSGLGNFRDNIESMQKAVQYLKKYSECRELRKLFT
jgi:hypothetical protein